jgi:hypothetical protein
VHEVVVDDGEEGAETVGGGVEGGVEFGEGEGAETGEGGGGVEGGGAGCVGYEGLVEGLVGAAIVGVDEEGREPCDSGTPGFGDGGAEEFVVSAWGWEVSRCFLSLLDIYLVIRGELNKGRKTYHCKQVTARPHSAHQHSHPRSSLYSYHRQKPQYSH